MYLFQYFPVSIGEVCLTEFSHGVAFVVPSREILEGNIPMEVELAMNMSEYLLGCPRHSPKILCRLWLIGDSLHKSFTVRFNYGR